MKAIRFFVKKILDECLDRNASWMAIRSYAIEILRIIDAMDNNEDIDKNITNY